MTPEEIEQLFEEIEQLSIDCEAEAHYYEGLRKLGESLGYKEDGYRDYFPWPVADMFQEIERLRQDVSFLLELVDDEDLNKFRRFQEGRDLE